MRSPASTRDQALGIAVAIRLGSDEALDRLASDLDSLRLEKEFDRIIFAIHNVLAPSGPQSMAALLRLVERRSGVPGLDAALGKALQRAESKDTLPVLALLLASSDLEAKRTAAWAFHCYTALAGPDGLINRSGDGQHPFRTEETTRFSGWDRTISAADHAAFWESWWSEHKALLGFLR
jgi:hypothetical protein